MIKKQHGFDRSWTELCIIEQWLLFWYFHENRTALASKIFFLISFELIFLKRMAQLCLILKNPDLFWWFLTYIQQWKFFQNEIPEIWDRQLYYYTHFFLNLVEVLSITFLYSVFNLMFYALYMVFGHIQEK